MIHISRGTAMKALAIFGAILIFTTTTASAADLTVSNTTLGEMGLAAMRPLVDDEGLGVRGKGTFAGVFGSSSVTWGGPASSSNNYFASSSWMGPQGSSAFGGTNSFGGNFQFGQFSW
jgi:hypothetical protein